MTAADLTGTVADLAVGDHLIHLGGVGFAQMADPDTPPVIVGDVRPSGTGPDPDRDVTQIETSAGTLFAHLDTTARFLRDDAVRPGAVLLISKRRMLHAALATLGTPVVRRTPVEPGNTVPEVSGREWAAAPLVVIDGYLSQTTLSAMWARGDLRERDRIIMVATDPDDVRVPGRMALATASALLLLPHDRGTLAGLFHAATRPNAPGSDPFPGILTPATTGRWHGQ